MIVLDVMKMKLLVFLTLLASIASAQESKWKMKFSSVYSGLNKSELIQFFEDFEKEHGKKEIQRIETEWSHTGGIMRVEFDPTWDAERECWNYKLLYFDLTKGRYEGLKLSERSKAGKADIESKIYFGSSRREGTILGANLSAKDYEKVRKILMEADSIDLHSYGKVRGNPLRWSIERLYFENGEYYILLSSPFRDNLTIEEVDGEFVVSSRGIIDT
jgi:hypothetical protein